MGLEPGSRLGIYEIRSALGAGGMGEVYRARDIKLDRTVAVKVLPDAVAHDSERLARFDREARLLAQVNHPHIAGIYGLEDDGGRKFLVLEFVDGESLAERLSSGPLPVAESLRLARQLVDALEAAHERGVIHRDLKPANIMITGDGQVKVLDFGLAKQVETVSQPELSQSPTLSFGGTRAGVILGTAAYMSPEQVRGRPADKRSDVWAFGCVLYEMLTAKRAFTPATGTSARGSTSDAEEISDTLASILRADPNLAALPAETPPQARTIVARCLEKDRKARIPDMSVIRFMLDGTLATAASAPETTRSGGGRAAVVWKAAAVLFFATSVAAIALLWPRAAPAPLPMRFLIEPPPGGAFSSGTVGRYGAFARISPDGSTIAFTARDRTGRTTLWVRPIESLASRELQGTDGAGWPFWSPDSREIAFSVPGKLLRVQVATGTVQTIATFPNPLVVGRGGAWSKDGVIVFNNGPGPLQRIAASGGQPSRLFPLAAGINHSFPSFLPDQHHFVFHFSDDNAPERAGLYLSSLDGGEPTRLLAADTGGVFAARWSRLLFVRQGTLLAQPFDATTLTLSGEAQPIAENVESAAAPGVVAFSVSDDGNLAYGLGMNSGPGLALTWVDRSGKTLARVGPQGDYRGIDLTPDGKRVAVHRHDVNGGDVWTGDATSGAISRLTFDAGVDNSSPIWSPDGTMVAFSARRDRKWSLFRKRADGIGASEQLVEVADAMAMPMAWTPDGSALLYEVGRASPSGSGTGALTGSADIWLLPLTRERKPAILLEGPRQQSHAQVSPNGRWLAYYSNETGRQEVFVESFPPGAGKWQISVDGGLFPRWRGDSRELYFMSLVSGGKMMAVDIVSDRAALEYGTPKELFNTEYVNLAHPPGMPYHAYSVSPNGQQFLIPRLAFTNLEAARIAVVLNWQAAAAASR